MWSVYLHIKLTSSFHIEALFCVANGEGLMQKGHLSQVLKEEKEYLLTEMLGRDKCRGLDAHVGLS